MTPRSDLGAPIKLGVVVDHGSSGPEWHRRYLEGQRHEPSPWEYSLADAEFDLTYSADHSESRLGSIVRKALRRVVGFDFIHIWRNRRMILSQDVLWAHTDKEHLALCALLLLKRDTRIIVIGQTVWLYDDIPRFAVHRRLIKKLLQRLNVETLHTAIGVRAALTFAPGRSVVQLPFGSSYRPVSSLRQASHSGRALFVAPGNDKHRDWDVLLRAATVMSHVDFLIACHPDKLRSAIAIPPNVTVRRLEGIDELKSVYMEAAAIVVPLRPNLHASGVTVVLEAVGQGVPLVTCMTGGIGEYLPDAGALIYAEGEAESLVHALEAVLASPLATLPGVAFLRERGLRAVDYVARHMLVTKALLAGQPIPEAKVAGFAPLEEADALESR